jgi:hypothetical protein
VGAFRTTSQQKTQVAPAIFVCYRRDDSAGHAGRLFDRLKQQYGHASVFWDVSGSIEPGEPFDRAIERATSQCDVLLAVIGRQWLTSTDATGKRRLDDPNDFVRLEVGAALARDVPVVPVLVQRAVMPRAEDLPQELRPLARRQAIELTDGRWDSDVSELIERLDRVLSRPQRDWRLRSKKAVPAILLVSGVLAIWAGWSTLQSPRPARTATALAPSVDVPDVRLVPLETAREQLAKARLRLGPASFFTLGRHAPNTVYEQWVAPGTQVPENTAVGVTVERARRSDVQFSARVFLAPGAGVDLDGDNTGHQDEDVRLSMASGPNMFDVRPANNARIADTLTGTDRDSCEEAVHSHTAYSVLVSHDDTGVCVRTNRGRYAFLRVDVFNDQSDDVPWGHARADFDTWQPPSPPAGVLQARFFEGGSYHLLTGVLVGREGDFYLSPWDYDAERFKFLADRDHQRGLVDLGNIGNVALDRVPIPKTGFERFGVPVVVGHTYVSQAPDGEQGHVVVLRVSRATDREVVFSYIYR